MSYLSIADAKAQFAQLITQAEGRQAVRITRLGKRVAVRINDAELQGLRDQSERPALDYSQLPCSRVI